MGKRNNKSRTMKEEFCHCVQGLVTVRVYLSVFLPCMEGRVWFPLSPAFAKLVIIFSTPTLSGCLSAHMVFRC